MTATQIIQEIKQLAPGEREEVLRFVREMNLSKQLTGSELSSMAEKLADAADEKEATVLKEEIKSGFYGKK